MPHAPPKGAATGKQMGCAQARVDVEQNPHSHVDKNLF